MLGSSDKHRQALYTTEAELQSVDARGASLIEYIESTAEQTAWEAIHDRLQAVQEQAGHNGVAPS